VRLIAAPLWLACLLASVAWAGRAYVSNEDGNSVTVIDTQRAEVIATINVGKRPRGMKVDRAGKRLFVALSGLPKCPPTVPDEECAKLKRDMNADGIAIVDTASHKVLRVLAAGSDPEQFDLSADEKQLFVANEDIGRASIVDIASGKVVASIPVGSEPEGVAVSPDGRWALVTNESDHAVSMIDTRTLKAVKSFPVGQRPRDIAFTPDSKSAYVTGEFDASLYRVNLQGAEPARQVLQLRKEARPMAVVLDTPRKRLYMSTGRGGTVAVIDATDSANLTLVSEVPVGTRPWGIALSPDGKRLYTANGPSHDVSIVDTTTLLVIKKIPAGRSPWGVVLGPVHDEMPQAR
jgi:YVTN family beta-propeller protein